MQQVLTNNHLDTLELRIKAEQAPLKKELKPGLIEALRPILDNCFKSPKSKRENFITREKLVLDLLKVFQSQKKFKSSENVYSSFTTLAAFDNKSSEIGKVININIMEQTIEFVTYRNYIDGKDSFVKNFNEVALFDYNSVSMEPMHRQYKADNPSGLAYLDMYNFLSGKKFTGTKVSDTFTKDYGEEIVKIEECPVIMEIIETYGIPEEIVKKAKKMLYKINIDTMEVIGQYESVKEAAEDTKISASTISNVLCQGKSAMKYIDAGGFKWAYSDTPNQKYSKEPIMPAVYVQVSSTSAPASSPYTLHL